jgi:hypothetical protein
MAGYLLSFAKRYQEMWHATQNKILLYEEIRILYAILMQNIIANYASLWNLFVKLKAYLPYSGVELWMNNDIKLT